LFVTQLFGVSYDLLEASDIEAFLLLSSSKWSILFSAFAASTASGRLFTTDVVTLDTEINWGLLLGLGASLSGEESVVGVVMVVELQEPVAHLVE